MIAKTFLIIGAINALLSVVLGAFATHGLKNKLDQHYLNVFQTGVEYQFYHALGLILIGIVCAQWLPNGFLKSSGWVMLFGIIVFSGSLYVLSITQIRWLGAITPIGGVSFIIAWGLFIVGVMKSQVAL